MRPKTVIVTTNNAREIKKVSNSAAVFPSVKNKWVGEKLGSTFQRHISRRVIESFIYFLMNAGALKSLSVFDVTYECCVSRERNFTAQLMLNFV